MAKRRTSKDDYGGLLDTSGASQESEEVSADAGDDTDTSTGGDKTKRLNVNLPSELHHAFKGKAHDDRRTMTDLVEGWVRDYVEGRLSP